MKIYLYLFLFCFSTLSQAQIFTNYTVDNSGLSSNSVNCVAVNSNDDLWVGTQKGLNFFDGFSWIVWSAENGSPLVNSNVTAVAVDVNDGVWIGTDFGLNHYDMINWTLYTEDNGLADNRVKYIREDAEGNIWVANNDGISIFDGSSWVSYTMADGIPFGGVNYVTFDDQGIAYLSTPLSGILVFDGNEFVNITEEDGLISDKIRSLEIAENGDKWVGTADGISVLDADDNHITNHSRIFILPAPDTLNPVEDLKIDSKGNIWVGVYIDYLVTEGGVSFYDQETWLDYEVEDGIAGPNVRRLDIDSQDIIWVATSSGLTKIGQLPSQVDHLNHECKIEISPNPSADFIQVMTQNQKGNLPYKILSLDGKLMKQGILNSTITSIKIDDLENGMYMMSIDDLVSQSFIVQH